MKQKLQHEFEYKITFLLGFKFSQGLGNMALVKLSYLMEEINVKIGSRITLEGDKAKYIYLIRDGEFEISKKFYLKEVKFEGTHCMFLRYISTKKTKRVSQTLSPSTMMLYLEN